MKEEKQAPKDLLSNNSMAATATSTLSELAARTRASQRLTPLPNGIIDPLRGQSREPLPIRDDIESRRAVWRYFNAYGLATNDPNDFIASILMRGVA